MTRAARRRPTPMGESDVLIQLGRKARSQVAFSWQRWRWRDGHGSVTPATSAAESRTAGFLVGQCRLAHLQRRFLGRPRRDEPAAQRSRASAGEQCGGDSDRQAADLFRRRPRQCGHSQALGRRAHEEGQRRGPGRKDRLHPALVLHAGRRARLSPLRLPAALFRAGAEGSRDDLFERPAGPARLSRRPAFANVTPSWYGELVGHYEGDTLVVDTIGLNDKTFVDNFRTPHTEKLHVVERFKLVDGGKAMRVDITFEDPDAFNAPWSVTQRYDRVQASDGRVGLRGEQRAVLQNPGSGQAGFLKQVLHGPPRPRCRRPSRTMVAAKGIHSGKPALRNSPRRRARRPADAAEASHPEDWRYAAPDRFRAAET